MVSLAQTSTQPVQLSSRLGAGELERLPPCAAMALYVHVPFCFHKCHYCDFYSITRQTPERMERFVDRILAEAALWTAARGPARPTTVFFGGGTPSLLPHGAMRRLLDGLAARFDLSGVREWTVEVNPATADAEYLRMMRACGVDRVSLGAQSFDRQDLAALERHHDPEDVPRAVEMARAAGFRRISLDLIYAIPGQTLASWERTLDRALGLGVEHLSCYGLTYEANTPLTVRRRLGRITAAPVELELQMFRRTREIAAKAGLAAYEISNFAVPGEESLHNLHYWRAGSYIGLGPSAASHVEGVRFRNTPHLRRWERAGEGGEAGELEVVDYEELSPEHRVAEAAMLGLRLAEGIEPARLDKRFGGDFGARFGGVVRRLVEPGLLVEREGRVVVSGKGLALTDAIASEFLREQADPVGR